MKTKKKLLVALLSAVCLAAGALGITACAKDKGTADTRDQNIVAIYEQYVAYATESGTTPLSYEQWLESIKGADGANGKSAYEIAVENGFKGTEQEWLEGLKAGEVLKVEYSEADRCIYITYSDREEPVKVELPEILTHVHSYNRTQVTTVVEPTYDKEGIGYVVCQDNGCDNIELVVIPCVGYKVTVVDYKGDPATGVEISVGGKSGVTDENGVAMVEGVKRCEQLADVTAAYGSNGTYTLNGYLQLTEESEATLKLPQTFTGGALSEGTYVVRINNAADSTRPDKYAMGVVGATLYSDDEPAKYRVTVLDPNGNYSHPNSYQVASDPESGNTSFEVAFKENSSYAFQFSADSVGNLANEPGSYSFTFTVEELETPVYGSIDLPYGITAEDVSDQDYQTESGDYNGGDGYVYFKITKEDISQAYRFKLNWDEGVKVVLLGSKIANEGYELTSDNNAFNIEQYANVAYLKVSASEESASFDIMRYYLHGEKQNPIELTENETQTAAITISGTSEYWYYYTATATKEMTLVDTNSVATRFEVYENVNQDAIVSSGSSRLKFTAVANKTYYVKVTNVNRETANFMIRAYDEVLDAGYSTTSPRVITENGEYSVDNIKDGAYMYFQYTAPVNGELTVKGTNIVLLQIFNNAEYDYGYDSRGGVTYEGMVSKSGGVSGYAMQAGMSVWIKVSTDNVGESLTITLSEVDKVDYEITVTDGENAIGAGVTVNLVYNGETVASGVTGADGKAVINAYPWAYDVELVLGDYAGDYEYVTKATTTYNTDGEATTVSLSEKFNYSVTLTLPDGTTPVTGATVTIGGVEATEGENGVYTSDEKLLPGSYAVVAQLTEAYNDYVLMSCTTSSDEYSLTAELTAKLTYTVKVVLPDGTTSVTGATVTVGELSTTYSDGAYIANGKLTPAVYDVTVELDGETAENYVVDAAKTTADSAEVTVKLVAYATYTENVVDSYGNGVTGVTVQIRRSSTEQAVGTTGEDEYAPVTAKLRSDYTYTARLMTYDTENYQGSTSAVYFDENGVVTIVLTCKNDFTVTVKDAEGSPLANASVTANGTAMTTDGNGNITVRVFVGSSIKVAYTDGEGVDYSCTVTTDASSTALTADLEVVKDELSGTYSYSTSEATGFKGTATVEGTYTLTFSDAMMHFYRINSGSVNYCNQSKTVTLNAGDTITIWCTVIAGSVTIELQ